MHSRTPPYRPYGRLFESLMNKEEARMMTFELWPARDRIDIRQMAMAGFYYLGTSDIVECFCCKLNLHEWLDTDNPFEEHKKYNKFCPYLFNLERNNTITQVAKDDDDNKNNSSSSEKETLYIVNE